MSVQLMIECRVEAVGMASSMLEPGLLLLTGGCGRQGRNTAATVLMREHEGWKHAVTEFEGRKCVYDLPYLYLQIFSMLEQIYYRFLFCRVKNL